MPPEVGRAEQAITAHQDAAAIFRDTGDRQGETRALANLGLALHAVGRAAEAITAQQDAAAISGAAGDEHWEHTALDNLEVARAALQGDHDN
ncbi:MAG: tetratricopeptide repeat protein [Streptosporangiaceae bacterium]